MKKKKKLELHSIYNNKEFKKWSFFTIETLVSAFVGALIAFVFGSNYIAAIIAFFGLMLFLIIMTIGVLLIENKISLLSIMQQGIDEERYEDVIKYGNAMSVILFESNKNWERVKLGNKIIEACSFLEKNKGSYYKIEGKKTLKQIQINTLLDDLGWSLHLCNQNEEAENNIQNAISLARREAKKIIQKYDGEDISDDDKKSLEVYVHSILKGYRHLTGIYYTSSKTYSKGVYYEKIAKLIVSCGVIMDSRGICENRNSTETCILPGLFCSKDSNSKRICALNNIIQIFFSDDVIIDNNKINEYIGARVIGYIDPSDAVKDIEIFTKLDKSRKISELEELSYSWGRNIVKKLQQIRNQKTDLVYLSDEEISCKINEAEAYAVMYYYGKEFSNVDVKDIDYKKYLKKNYDSILIKKEDNLTKKDLRFLTLMNEIYLESLIWGINHHQINNINEKNQLISDLKNSVSKAIEVTKIPRTDLYVRNSLFLMELHLVDFNYNHRYININNRNKKVDEYLIKIKNIYLEIEKFINKYNEIVEVYTNIKQQLVNNKKVIYKKTTNQKSLLLDDPIVKAINELSENNEIIEFNENLIVSPEMNKLIEDLKRKWGISK